MQTLVMKKLHFCKSVFGDRSLCGQTFKEMEEHVKSDHKQAFDDEVIGWHGWSIKWNNCILLSPTNSLWLASITILSSTQGYMCPHCV